MSIPNIEKLLQYLNCVSTQPIKFKGKIDNLNSKLQIVGDEIKEIRLNDKFFYNDSCQMCGGCDPAESNVYTYSEYEAILKCTTDEFQDAGLDPKYLLKLQSGLIKEDYIINDEKVSVWTYNQEENELYLPTRGRVLSRCTWCFKDQEHKFKCRIHPVESITCIMPHLRIFHVKGTNKSSIGISQFGRNWLLKCPVILGPPENKEQFEYNKKNRIEKLTILNRIGLDLNIETYLPQVIQYVDKCNYENYKSYLNVNVLGKSPHKLF